MNKNFKLVLSLFFLPLLVVAQPSARRFTNAEYIQKYRDDAIRDMKKMGVPASITLAQGILESDAGNSDLAIEANNHFGIKCHKEWTGETFIKDDDAKDECFRKYRTVFDSFDDHGRFLRERSRYAFLFEYDITDYKSWAHGLKSAGYATNPRYAELLIKIIEENDLHRYDNGKNIPVTAATNPSAITQSNTNHVKPNAQPKDKSAGVVHENEHEVTYVYAKSGDSYYSIAVANEMRMWQVLKYNEADKNDNLSEGDIVYLKPKRGKPSEQFHIVGQNETLHFIAQKYCVKQSRLMKLNKMGDSVAVQPGQKIILK